MRFKLVEKSRNNENRDMSLLNRRKFKAGVLEGPSGFAMLPDERLTHSLFSEHRVESVLKCEIQEQVCVLIPYKVLRTFLK